MRPQSFARASHLATYSLSSPLLYPVLISFYWSLQSDIFFFSILTERFYTINYTTLNIFGDSYRLFSTFLQNPANHKNERAIRKEDDPPYSHRTGSCIFAGNDTKLAPHLPPPHKTYPQVGVGNEISEQVVLPLTTPSTPVTSVTIPIPVSKAEKKNDWTAWICRRKLAA